jgi:hypothetical protein
VGLSEQKKREDKAVSRLAREESAKEESSKRAALATKERILIWQD